MKWWVTLQKLINMPNPTFLKLIDKLHLIIVQMTKKCCLLADPLYLSGSGISSSVYGPTFIPLHATTAALIMIRRAN